MTLDHTSYQMTIEKLETKVQNQAMLIKGLTTENEELFHQYNHLMIRNQKMLKRVDDLQKIIDDLHIRIEELQLINGNMMQINDKLRRKGDGSLTDYTSRVNDNLNGHVDNLLADFDLDGLYDRWRNYPGQSAQNAPNLKKQVSMLALLYRTKSLRAADLFSQAGVGGVTGARYVSVLKKYGLICYTGARKKGHYEITRDGINFIENTMVRVQSDPLMGGPSDNPISRMPEGISLETEPAAKNSMDYHDL